MPGALEFRKLKVQEAGLGLLEPEWEVVKVTFPNPKAALLLDPGRNFWAPWGRRKEEAGDWPEGGWAREESLKKVYWTRWDPELLPFPALRWMEKDAARKSHWIDVPEGQRLLGLRLMAAPGRPVYLVTQASYGDYAEIHERMPKLVPLS